MKIYLFWRPSYFCARTFFLDGTIFSPFRRTQSTTNVQDRRSCRFRSAPRSAQLPIGSIPTARSPATEIITDHRPSCGRRGSSAPPSPAGRDARTGVLGGSKIDGGERSRGNVGLSLSRAALPTAVPDSRPGRIVLGPVGQIGSAAAAGPWPDGGAAFDPLFRHVCLGPGGMLSSA